MNGEGAVTGSPSRTHLLTGLEADNLLAFLALLGLLRALDAVRPEWAARVAWSGTPPSAELHFACGVGREDAIAQANTGIHRLGGAYHFDRKDLKYTADEFRATARDAQRDREHARLVAALSSDAALKRGSRNEEVAATPLCAMFGQGHQHFLSRLTEMAHREDKRDEADLEGALFEQWRYQDKTEGFRWDPREDRRYAHQSGDPSEARNKIGTVTGANRLAAIGLSVLTSVPTSSGLATLGVSGDRRERRICWPIVGTPTSLSGYVALLAHPWLGDEQRAPGLARYGVVAVARARRYQVEKYFNFERARLQFL